LPAAPLHRPTASDADSNDPTQCTSVAHIIGLFAWGRELVTTRGGVPKMRRLLAALSTLATLFVVAGAGWKF
jgi:hypothetical protein